MSTVKTEQATPEKIDFKKQLKSLNKKYRFSLTVKKLGDKVKEETKLKENIEAEIKTISEDKLVLFKSSKLKKLGKTRDEVITDIQKTRQQIKDAKNGDGLRGAVFKGKNYVNEKVSVMSQFAKSSLIDKKYAGKNIDEILKTSGYNVTSYSNTEDKEPKKEKDEPIKVKDTEDKEPKKNFKVNINKITPEKTIEVDEKIYDYLIKIGEFDIANYVLDILTTPENKKVSEDKQFDDENIKKLSIINNNILEKLTQIEKDMIDEQDTSVQNKESNIQQAKFEDKPKISNNSESDSDSSWLGNIFKMFLGGGALRMLKNLIISMGKKGWSLLVGIIENGWEFLDKQIIKRFLPWIEEKVGLVWDKTTKFVGEAIETSKKFILESAEKMVNSAIELFQKSMQWITDILKKVPYISEILEKSTNFLDKAVNATKSGISTLVESGSKIGSTLAESGAVAVKSGSKILGKLGGKLIAPAILGYDMIHSVSDDTSETGISTGSKVNYSAWNTAENFVSIIPGVTTAVRKTRAFFNQDEQKLMDILKANGIISEDFLGAMEIKNWEEIFKLSRDNLELVYGAYSWDSETKNRLKQLLQDKLRDDQSSFSAAKLNQNMEALKYANYGLNIGGTAETFIEPGKAKKYSSDLKTLDSLSVEGYTDIKNRIKTSEGLILHPYRDSRGFWTIGYGHLMVAENGDFEKYPMGQDISKEQAEAIFEADFAKHYKGASNIPGFSQQPDGVQNALIDMTYNMGDYWYKQWPNFMAQLNSGDYNSAAQNILDSNYAQQVGNRAKMNAKLIMMAGQNKDAYKKENEAQKSIGITDDMRDDAGNIKPEFKYIETAKAVGDSKKLQETVKASKKSLDMFISKNPQNENTGKWENGEFIYFDENTQAKYKSLTNNLSNAQKSEKYIQDIEETNEAQKKEKEAQKVTEQNKINEVMTLDLSNKGDKRVNEANGTLPTEKVVKETTQTSVVDKTGKVFINNKEITDQSLEEIFILK